MERLTFRMENGQAGLTSAGWTLPHIPPEWLDDKLNEAVNRLADYEDTELEPQEIKSLLNQIARLKRQNGEAAMIGRAMQDCIYNIDDALSRGKWAIEQARSHDQSRGG